MLYVYPIILIKGRLYHSTYSVGVVKSGRGVGGMMRGGVALGKRTSGSRLGQLFSNGSQTVRVGKILKTNNNDIVSIVVRTAILL